MNGIALYIHWPFCKAKCPYCDFNSHVRARVDQDAWREAMLKELRWYHTQWQPAKSQTEQARGGEAVGFGAVTAPFKKRITSIFFGGGTPSLMPPETVGALIDEAEKIFGFTEGVEITLEANPTSVEAEKFRAYRSAGINRLSLGVQSLTPRHLTFLGREHSVEEARQAIQLASSNFNRFSFDLIYALYDQSLNDWKNELKAALELAGNHLSLYQLTIEPGTQFYHRYQSGKLPILSADDSARYYELTQEIMEAAGMPAYEISNHARPGNESRHNLVYWRGGDYLGIGPGAHGRVLFRGESSPSLHSSLCSAPRLARLDDNHNDCVRIATTNLRSPEKWLEQVQTQGHGQETAMALTPQEHREERLMMGIRLREGIERALFNWPEKLLAPLEQEGLITLTPTHLIPTAGGRLVLNALVEKLCS